MCLFCFMAPLFPLVAHPSLLSIFLPLGFALIISWLPPTRSNRSWQPGVHWQGRTHNLAATHTHLHTHTYTVKQSCASTNINNGRHQQKWTIRISPSHTYIHTYRFTDTPWSLGKKRSVGSGKQWWRYCRLSGNERGGEWGLITGAKEIERGEDGEII